jgi:hypothetical protein
MPRPRLQRAATARPEKIQLPIAEQNYCWADILLDVIFGVEIALRRDVYPDDDDVFHLFLQKQKVGAELHIYLEEGTYHKRLFRGPNTSVGQIGHHDTSAPTCGSNRAS